MKDNSKNHVKINQYIHIPACSFWNYQSFINERMHEHFVKFFKFGM